VRSAVVFSKGKLIFFSFLIEIFRKTKTNERVKGGVGAKRLELARVLETQHERRGEGGEWWFVEGGWKKEEETNACSTSRRSFLEFGIFFCRFLTK